MNTIILLIIGFLVGLIVRPMLKSHKHDYELLLHRKLGDIDIHHVQYEISERERKDGLKLNFDSVFVSYKKCKTCGDVVINVSNGTGREFRFDYHMVKDKIEIILKKEKEEADQALLDSVNNRIAGKEVLTSPEVPYNLAHGNQATPQ